MARGKAKSKKRSQKPQIDEKPEESHDSPPAASFANKEICLKGSFAADNRSSQPAMTDKAPCVHVHLDNKMSNQQQQVPRFDSVEAVYKAMGKQESAKAWRRMLDEVQDQIDAALHERRLSQRQQLSTRENKQLPKCVSLTISQRAFSSIIRALSDSQAEQDGASYSKRFEQQRYQFAGSTVPPLSEEFQVYFLLNFITVLQKYSYHSTSIENTSKKVFAFSPHPWPTANTKLSQPAKVVSCQGQVDFSDRLYNILICALLI